MISLCYLINVKKVKTEIYIWGGLIVKTKILFVIVVLFFMIGCAPSIVRFKMEEPIVQREVRVRGLESNDKIVEISDAYKGQYDQEGNFWVVISRKSNFFIGEIDFNSGNVTNLKVLDNYDSGYTIYWDKLNETKMGEGEKLGRSCLTGCCMGVPIKTDEYGFDAEKSFWGDKNHRIQISWQWAQISRSHQYGTEYRRHGKISQKFLKGDNVASINENNSFGYFSNYDVRGNIKKFRFYPAGDDIYIGAQPSPPLEEIIKVDFFAYDLKTSSSYGADMDFLEPNYYVDTGVNRDGNLVSIITGSPGNYLIRQFSAKDFIKAIKLFKASQ